MHFSGHKGGIEAARLVSRCWPEVTVSISSEAIVWIVVTEVPAGSEKSVGPGNYCHVRLQ